MPALALGDGTSAAAVNATAAISNRPSARRAKPMPSRGGIDDWVEQAGLGLIPNLSQQLTSYAGNLEQLRSMSQDDIEAALLPLKLRGITAAKVKSALEALRNPDDASSIHRGLGVSVEGGGSAAAATMAELQKAGVAPPPVQTSPPPKPLRGTKEANKEEVADLMTMLSPRGGQQLSERQRSHSNVPSPELQAAIAAQERMAAEAAVAEAEAEAARAEAQAAEAEAEAAEAAVAAASGRGEEDIDEDAETLAAIAAVAAFEASETAARDLSKQGGGSTKLPLTLNLPKELCARTPRLGSDAALITSVLLCCCGSLTVLLSLVRPSAPSAHQRCSSPLAQDQRPAAARPQRVRRRHARLHAARYDAPSPCGAELGRRHAHLHAAHERDHEHRRRGGGAGGGAREHDGG